MLCSLSLSHCLVSYCVNISREMRALVIHNFRTFTVNQQVRCSAFGRNNGVVSSMSRTSAQRAYTGSSQYSSHDGMRRSIMAQNDLNESMGSDEMARKQKQATSASGLSAWGLISIIMFIIAIGMAAYYGIICYPIICREERHYDLMDGASTTASASTPTRASDFEKSGNYSSRSNTPTVIINPVEYEKN